MTDCIRGQRQDVGRVSDWEENWGIVDQGSNRRIVIGRVSAIAMEENDEEQIEHRGGED